MASSILCFEMQYLRPYPPVVVRCCRQAQRIIEILQDLLLVAFLDKADLSQNLAHLSNDLPFFLNRRYLPTFSLGLYFHPDPLKAFVSFRPAPTAVMMSSRDGVLNRQWAGVCSRCRFSNSRAGSSAKRKPKIFFLLWCAFRGWWRSNDIR